MRLLLTSDLHMDGKKFLWLLDSSPECDAVLVAGDILAMFSSQPFASQAESANRWREAIVRTGRDFVWCSGNHDVLHGSMRGSGVGWMRNRGSTPRYVGDGETGLVAENWGGMAVTSIPWPLPHPVPVDERRLGRHRSAYLALVGRLAEEGRRIKTERGIPWIVLLHQPPGETPLAAGANTSRLNSSRRFLESTQPDFSLHGHIHRAPSEKNGSWIWQIGRTVCFNTGQSEAGEIPNFIVLDWRGPGDWTAVWEGDGRTQRAESSDLEPQE